jgi:tetratricopeptide (TPR) repeat protein
VAEHDTEESSWLDAFKREKPTMESAEPAAGDADDPIPAPAEQKSWLGFLKGKQDETEVVVEATAASDAEAATPTTTAESATSTSTSWLDMFKSKQDSEATEAAPEPVEAPTAADDSAVAAAPAEPKSSSWLDMFKRRSSEVESGDTRAEETPAVDSATAEAEAADTAATPANQAAGSAADSVAQSAESESQTTAAVVSADEQMSKASLRLARAAYWNRDYEAANAIYENMTRAQPDNMELLGEYGNFLLQAGKIDKALNIYAAVAKRLIAEKRSEEALPLIDFIGTYAPERADKIAAALESGRQDQ